MRLPRQWNERSLNVSYRTEKSRVHGCQESGFRNKRVESNSLPHGAYSCPTLHSLLQALHRVQPLSFPIASIILVTSTPTALEGFTLASRCWCSQAEMYCQQDGVNPCSQTLSAESSKDIPTIHQSASLPKNLMLICPCTFFLCFYFLFQIRTLKHLIIITSFTDMLLN